MRILIVGAGATGGYFGGRLLENGADVTFLVRQRRKEQLQQKGLRIHSVHGDTQQEVQVLTSGEEAQNFDLILISVKAFQLSQALESVQPYVGEETVILPVLNGVTHLSTMETFFGEQKVIGGLCFIEANLNQEG